MSFWVNLLVLLHFPVILSLEISLEANKNHTFQLIDELLRYNQLGMVCLMCQVGPWRMSKQNHNRNEPVLPNIGNKTWEILSRKLEKFSLFCNSNWNRQQPQLLLWKSTPQQDSFPDSKKELAFSDKHLYNTELWFVHNPYWGKGSVAIFLEPIWLINQMPLLNLWICPSWFQLNITHGLCFREEFTQGLPFPSLKVTENVTSGDWKEQSLRIQLLYKVAVSESLLLKMKNNKCLISTESCWGLNLLETLFLILKSFLFISYTQELLTTIQQ